MYRSIRNFNALQRASPGYLNFVVAVGQMSPSPGLEKNAFLLIFSFNLTAVIFSLIIQFLNVY